MGVHLCLCTSLKAERDWHGEGGRASSVELPVGWGPTHCLGAALCRRRWGAGRWVLRWPRLAAPQRALSQTPEGCAPQGRGAAALGAWTWGSPGQAWSMQSMCGSGQSGHCPGQACGSPVHSPGAGVVVVVIVEGWGTRQHEPGLSVAWDPWSEGARGSQAWGSPASRFLSPAPVP